MHVKGKDELVGDEEVKEDKVKDDLDDLLETDEEVKEEDLDMKNPFDEDEDVVIMDDE